MGKTAAQRKKKQRERLKASGRYEEFRHKETQKQNDSRRKKKLECNIEEKERMRQKKREDMRKYRIKIKQKQSDTLRNIEPEPSEQTPSKAFRTRSAYGKAVAKVKKNLPFSPRKCKAVVKTLATQLTPEILSPNTKKRQGRTFPQETTQIIKDFYLRDDISRQSPGIKDTKLVRLENGTKEKVQVRHLYNSVIETHALFCEKYGPIVGKSKFAELRPKHVLLSSQTPENVCLCKYHENFISAVNTLSKCCGTLPTYDNNYMISMVVCDDHTESCWYDKCAICKPKYQTKILEAIEGYSDKNVFWCIWREEDGRLKKVKEEGTVLMLSEHILKMIPVFKEHFYIKRKQAQSYEEDRNTVMTSTGDTFSLLQIDFAENYTCIAQDEVQSYHWVQPQVSLFTISLWYNKLQHPMVILSDNLNHTKDTVIVYIDRVLQEIPENINKVHIWSDGPASQFKNRFVANSLPMLQNRHNVEIVWNYFSTSHGKGPVDGIGGSLKRQVRSSVLRRECTVSNAREFEQAALKHSNIKVILMTDAEIKRLYAEMHLDTIFETATAIKQIKKKHKIYVNSFHNVTALSLSCHKLSIYNEIYSDSSEENENECPNVISQASTSETLNTTDLTAKNIRHGVHVLVKFPMSTNHIHCYRYAAICQSEVDDEGEVKIMSLKITNEDLFRVDEKDVSFVNFDNVLEILPEPVVVMKGNRMFYKFPKKLDIFEK